MEPWALKICFDRRPIGHPNAPLLPASAKSCCAPIRDVAPVGLRVERQCDNTVTGRLTASLRLVRFSSQPTSASPQAFWTLFIAPLKALTMRNKITCGPLHVGRFPTGCGWLPRGRARSEFALDAYPVSIPITTHLHTRQVGPIVAADEHSAVVLGRNRNFYVASLCMLWCALVCSPASKAAHSLTAELGYCAAD